jgi:hypothetical protein
MMRLARLSVLIALGGCVPFAGNYSDFAIRGRAKEPDVRSETQGFRPFVGGKYRGELRRGFPDGQGKFVFDDGRVYEGQFELGRRHGEGKLVYRDGRVVEGTFRDDVPSAPRSLTYTCGTVFRGVIKANVAQGDGVIVQPDGTVLVGTFVRDRLDGFGLEVTPTGEQFWGPFKEGLADGRGLCAKRGEATLCDKRDGEDVTQETIKNEIEKRASDAMTEEVRGQLATLDIESKRDEAALEYELGKRGEQKAYLVQGGGPLSTAKLDAEIAELGKKLGEARARVAAKRRQLEAERQRRLESEELAEERRRITATQEKRVLEEREKERKRLESICAARPSDCVCISPKLPPPDKIPRHGACRA